MTTIAESTIRTPSTVGRVLSWLKEFDEAFNSDPTEQSVLRLNRKIDHLERRVRELQASDAVTGGAD